MSRIRTIEDGYQYRVHHLLNKLMKDYEGIGFSKLSFRDWLETADSNGILGQMLKDDIEEYCGLDEAIENEY